MRLEALYFVFCHCMSTCLNIVTIHFKSSPSLGGVVKFFGSQLGGPGFESSW